MTGGQMAPTTLVGQVTTTSPYGRQKDHCGEPLRMSEMLATINGAAYIERVSPARCAQHHQGQKSHQKALQCQLDGKGFSMVEILSTCPTNWGMTPVAAQKWLVDNMIPYYPLGVKKEVE